MKKKKAGSNNILSLPKVEHEYTAISKFHAGIKLEGWMVKAIRNGNISVSGSAYVRPKNNEMFLHGIHVKPLDQNGMFIERNTDPVLKVLLKKKEILKIIEGEQRDGCTIVLRKLFWDNQFVKAEIWLAKGKKLYDKRQALKDKDVKRTKDRDLKNSF
jgi:SsrA-binding protein